MVIDASFALALALEESASMEVRRLVDEWVTRGEELYAPSLMGYELAGVLRSKVHRHLVLEADARAALDLLLALPISLLQTADLHVLAFEIAGELGLSTSYDAHYLALAEVLQADLWTLDERFADRARARYPSVRTVQSP